MGISAAQLGIVLVIILVIFGGKKLRTLGSDLGVAIREFKKGVEIDSEEKPAEKHDSTRSQ